MSRSAMLEAQSAVGVTRHMRAKARRRIAVHRMVLCGVSALCLAHFAVAQDAALAPHTPAPLHTFVVRAQMLIDGATAEPRRNQEIVVRGNRIAAVYASGAH